MPDTAQPGSNSTLRRPAFSRGVAARLTVTVLLLAAGAAASVLAEGIATKLVLSIALGFALSTILPLMHEGAHGNLSRNRWINDVTARLFGGLLLVDFATYRSMHLAHHEAFGTPDDPEPPVELSSLLDYLSLCSPRYFLYHCWRERLSALRHRWSRRDGAPLQVGERGQPLDSWVLTIACLPIAGGTLVWPTEMIWAYWVPLFWAGGWMFLTTVHEHYRFDGETESLTRSIQCGPVLAFLLWNTHRHEAHHAHPELHFSRLAEEACNGSSSPACMRTTFLRFHARLIGSLSRCG